MPGVDLRASGLQSFFDFDVLSSAVPRGRHRNSIFSPFSMSFQAPLRERRIGIPFFLCFRCLFKRRSARQASASLFFFVFDVFSSAAPRDKHRNSIFPLFSMSFQAPFRETSIGIPLFLCFRCHAYRHPAKQASESQTFVNFDALPGVVHETSIKIPATYPEFKIRRSLCPQ